jgi:protein-tyrosine-phosphatase
MVIKELKADMVIIVCSGYLCPITYGRHVEEWKVPDPAQMSLDEARHVRNTIKAKVFDLIERLKKV